MKNHELLQACIDSGQVSAAQAVAHYQAGELVEHHCPVDGRMSIEADAPCNWCGEVISHEAYQRSHAQP